MKNKWFFKWFVMDRRERNFVWFMEILSEKYDYCCKIKGLDLTFNEFLNVYIRELKEHI